MQSRHQPFRRATFQLLKVRFRGASYDVRLLHILPHAATMDSVSRSIFLALVCQSSVLVQGTSIRGGSSVSAEDVEVGRDEELNSYFFLVAQCCPLPFFWLWVTL